MIQSKGSSTFPLWNDSDGKKSLLSECTCRPVKQISVRQSIDSPQCFPRVPTAGQNGRLVGYATLVEGNLLSTTTFKF